MPIVLKNDFHLHATFKWRGDDWFNGLLPKLQAGVTDAATIYRQAVIRRYSRTTGSVPHTWFRRLRVRHSSPGQAPFAQIVTGKLSVRNSFNFNQTKGRLTIIKGRVSSDVPYSHTLEFGGALSVDPNRKKWTRIRLVNPLRTTPYIAPRPVWRPVFIENLVVLDKFRIL